MVFSSYELDLICCVFSCASCYMLEALKCSRIVAYLMIYLIKEYSSKYDDTFALRSWHHLETERRGEERREKGGREEGGLFGYPRYLS